ncbi:MAG: SDR family NAD(P)-dependent oxidoreductase [Bacilli bacterium]|nr:SDR family NAD(P)-dependent oxidoreductase [Bacilli bacterium]
MKKTVLLSGANGGIGKQILLYLLKEDYQVISLDISNNNIADLNTTFVKCDVTNVDEINNAFTLVKGITDELYAIINTVGIFMMQSVIEGSISDFEKIFNVNFFGVYKLNKIMFPLLKKGSRIINLTSELARYTPQPFQGYYNLSKIVMDNYTDVLRRECNYLGIKVIKVQSGSMATPLLKTANNEFDEMVNNSEHFKKPLTKLKYMMDRELKKSNDPAIIAKLIVKILNKKHPKIRYRKRNSFALSFMGHLPEKWQDKIYQRVIK